MLSALTARMFVSVTSNWKWAAVVLVVPVCLARADHEVTQSFDLRPGWNSIFLEVHPSNNTASAVFDDLPVAGVWRFIPDTIGVEYVQNLNEIRATQPHWVVHFPTNRDEAVLNNLFRVHANTPYFVNLEGSANVPWEVRGRPAVPTFDWQASTFNLTGFPLDPTGAPPSFADFLAPDAALAGQDLYRLDAGGGWERVDDPAAANPVAGEAVWLFADRGSDFTGPVQVSVEWGEGLDYQDLLTELRVAIENRGRVDSTVTISNLGGAGPLDYWEQVGQVESWTSLDSLDVGVASGTTFQLRLAVVREEFASDVYETTVQVTSDQGTRVRIPVRADR